MIRNICRFIFKKTGWQVDSHLPAGIKKCIIIAAPHTSNWDFWYTMAAFSIYKLRIRFTVKKEWMRFPFKIIMQPLGGIGIDRTPRANGQRPSFVDLMADLFATNEELIIVITPEGTRSKQTNWKTGFFHLAQKANVPILLGYVDYKTKIAGIGKTIYPTDIQTTMREIMDFYKNITPKFPEKFALDKSFF